MCTTKKLAFTKNKNASRTVHSFESYDATALFASTVKNYINTYLIVLVIQQPSPIR